jgi:hypothetical protein
MKIAILILAHKNFDQLRLLVDHLKTDFPVYVHVNKKVSHTMADEANLIFIKERYAPYWGSDNTVKAMLALLRAAYNDKCDYFAIISGQDLPLMSNQQLRETISLKPMNYVYHHPIPKPSWNLNGGLDRLQLYWPKKYGFKSTAGKLAELVLAASFGIVRKLQRITGLKRNINFQAWGGSMWLNLNKSAAKYIFDYLEKNPKFIRRFAFTRLSDEIFFQTILLGGDYEDKHHIVNDDMRFVDWETGPEYPRIFTTKDLRRCLSSQKFFGRKFDINADRAVIDRVLRHIKD